MNEIQTTTSGITIKGIDFNSIDIGTEVSERIYEIRNACIHSKKQERVVQRPDLSLHPKKKTF